MYLDPGGVIKRLYITGRDEIIGFMRTHIDYEHGEGVDIAICTKEISNAVICNHDGQVFLLEECPIIQPRPNHIDKYVEKL